MSLPIPDPHVTPVISVPHAGQIVDLGRSAAYEAARRGEIPTLKFGRKLRVPTAALLRMLDLEAARTADVEGEVISNVESSGLQPSERGHPAALAHLESTARIARPPS